MTTTDTRHEALGEATLGRTGPGIARRVGPEPVAPAYDEAASILNGAHDKETGA